MTHILDNCAPAYLESLQCDYCDGVRSTCLGAGRKAGGKKAGGKEAG